MPIIEKDRHERRQLLKIQNVTSQKDGVRTWKNLRAKLLIYTVNKFKRKSFCVEKQFNSVLFI